MVSLGRRCRSSERCDDRTVLISANRRDRRSWVRASHSCLLEGLWRPSVQCSEDCPLTRRRLDDNGAGHARADQDTFGHIIDMNAYWDPLGKPDPLKSRIDIGKQSGPCGNVAIGNAAADAPGMDLQAGSTHK